MGCKRLTYQKNETLLKVIQGKKLFFVSVGEEKKPYRTKNCLNAYKYKYNGKEWQDELDLNWYDYGARNGDPAVIPFTTIDPRAEEYYSQSPYAFAANNPVYFVDVNGEGVDWIPKIKDDGSAIYIKESGDSAKTLASQFGLKQNVANKLYKTMENGEISGQNAKDITGDAKMKLNLKSSLATSDRILQQFVFANDYSKSEGADKWGVNQYYTGWKDKNQTPAIIRGNVDINGEKVEMSIPFIWYTSKGNFFTGMSFHQAVYSNSYWGGATYAEGTAMTGRTEKFSSINVSLGYQFSKDKVNMSNNGMYLGVFRNNEKKMLKYLSRNIPQFRYKNNLSVNTNKN